MVAKRQSPLAAYKCVKPPFVMFVSRVVATVPRDQRIRLGEHGSEDHQDSCSDMFDLPQLAGHGGFHALSPRAGPWEH